MRREWTQAMLAVALSGMLGGCSLRKKPVPPAPPPLPPAIQPAPPEPVQPPGIDPRVGSLPEEEAPGMAEAPLPPAPKPPAPPKRRSRRPAAVARPAPAEPAEVEAPKTSEPSPQLGEVLTVDRRAELAQSFQTAASEARQDLARLTGRQLSSAQAQSAARIRGFLAQAEGMVETDPRSAAELARRAALLARDLVQSIR
jgi:hypothetical protein